MDSLRLGDAERESAMEVLSEHYALGRLTKEEFDERSDAVWSARTQGDLAPLFADLPAAQGSPGRGSLARHLRALEGRGPRGRGPAGLPVVPVLIALVVLTVATQLPFMLLLLVGFLCIGRWRHHASWSPRGHRGPYTGRY